MDFWKKKRCLSDRSLVFSEFGGNWCSVLFKCLGVSFVIITSQSSQALLLYFSPRRQKNSKPLFEPHAYKRTEWDKQAENKRKQTNNHIKWKHYYAAHHKSWDSENNFLNFKIFTLCRLNITNLFTFLSVKSQLLPISFIIYNNVQSLTAWSSFSFYLQICNLSTSTFSIQFPCWLCRKVCYM